MVERRLCVDGIRLSRRADALRVAVCEFTFWRSRHLRFPEGQFLLLPIVVDDKHRFASVAACNESAKWYFGSSSAILWIIFGIPTLETVTRCGDIPRPSDEVIFSMALNTFE